MNNLFGNENYKVLTLWQPWATLLVHGIKKIETRPGRTNWTVEKGTYLIHAANKWGKEQAEICLTKPFKIELEKLGFIHYTGEGLAYKGFSFSLPMCAIIGSIEVTGCYMVNNNQYYTDGKLTEIEKGFAVAKFSSHTIQEPELSFGNYETGRFAWLTKNPRILKTTIPYKGGQGYYQNFKGNTDQLIFT